MIDFSDQIGEAIILGSYSTIAPVAQLDRATAF
jgi:hypothetical protein